MHDEREARRTLEYFTNHQKNTDYGHLRMEEFPAEYFGGSTPGAPAYGGIEVGGDTGDGRYSSDSKYRATRIGDIPAVIRPGSVLKRKNPLPRRVLCAGGADGTRTRDLLRDRQAF